MANLRVDFKNVIGKIKPMNAVNNGPKMPSRMFSKSGNFDYYKEAGIPFARNHDAGLYSYYGGERTVDINAIFPNFDADPYDPASYDFICTDYYTQNTLDAGTKIFYRLGNKIDHRVKKYDSVPPKDFHKWAVICEHIIKHYNEGWADGFHWNIEYWEIWNEPENGRECWDGPFEDFLELFVIAAKHLKSKFPHLKIGGPAFATGGVDKRKDDFLKYMKERDVPLDFFSWHTYKSEACKYEKRIYAVRESLDRAGYTETESILNEWTYIINWHEGLRESIKTIISTKGAAFVSAIMATGQNSPLDMMMYYDARPDWPLNCLFDFYTGDRLKGYYSFKMFSELYRLGEHVESVSDDEEIYAVAAKNSEKSAVMLTYFTNNTEAESKKIELTLSGGADGYSVSLLDDNHDAESIGVFEVQNNKIQLTLEANTVVLLQSNA